MSVPAQHRAVRWHPPMFDIRVETVDTPKIQHPDDAIIKVKVAALCGSDLHVYRGTAKVKDVHTCGHEFVGEVVELGTNYGGKTEGRPALYSSLKIGDRVVSPFTVNCGECHVCRLGFTCRCTESLLFGSPALDGGQAQYVRVPRAGGTLFNLSDPSSWSSTLPDDQKSLALTSLSESSLLLLADILPTGVYAAVQAINSPKVLPITTARPWPNTFFPELSLDGLTPLTDEDKVLTFAVIGLGPVGVCTAVSLIDIVSSRKLPYRIVAIDPLASRRQKMQTIYDTITSSEGGLHGEFVVLGIEESKEWVRSHTQEIGCTAVLEVVGNNSAITLAYDLVRPFGTIISVGVHGPSQMPFTGSQVYDKNITFTFGRCPARAMFPLAFDLLVRRQDIFAGVGESSSLIHTIASLDQAPEMYRAFDKGEVGKVVFDVWK